MVSRTTTQQMRICMSMSMSSMSTAHIYCCLHTMYVLVPLPLVGRTRYSTDETFSRIRGTQ